MTRETTMKIRREAEAAFALVRETADALPDEEQRRRFWELMCRYFVEACKVVPDEDPADSCRMTEGQAKAFENSIIQFGQHTGKRIADIDLGYLRSDRVQREQDDG